MTSKASPIGERKITGRELPKEVLIEGPIGADRNSRPVVLEPYAVDKMPEYGYIQEEFFVSGNAADHEYSTRILVRRPRDMNFYNGRMLMEVSHIWGGTSVWRAYHRQIMRSGYIWIELDSQAPSALDLIQRKDPQRYSRMKFMPGELASDFAASIPFTENPTPEILAEQYDEFKERWWAATPQSFEIIAQVADRLRKDLPGINGSAAKTIAFGGISQTGGVVRKFIQDYHNRFCKDDGTGLIDLYLPGASGGDALPDIDAKVIEILGESEFQSVRWDCGVSGQTRGVSHRREDSESFRLYEVAGMAHRETRRMSDRDLERLKDCALPEGAHWSSFPNSHVYNALLELGCRWAEGETVPPESAILQTIGESDEIVRDKFGNAKGGLRTTYTDAPISSLVAATPMGRPSWYHGNETPLSADSLRLEYGDVSTYRQQLGEVLNRMLSMQVILPEDAEEIRLCAEEVMF